MPENSEEAEENAEENTEEQEDDTSFQVVRGNAITLPQVAPPALLDITSQLADTEINKADLQAANLNIQLLYHALPQAKTVESLCKLIDTHIRAAKHRRDLLCLPYGFKGAASRSDIVFPSIEDE